MARVRVHLALEATRRIDASTLELGTRPACSRSIAPSHRRASFRVAEVNCPACKRTEDYEDAQRAEAAPCSAL